MAGSPALPGPSPPASYTPSMLVRRICCSERADSIALLWDEDGCNLTLRRWDFGTIWRASTLIAKMLRAAIPAAIFAEHQRCRVMVGLLLEEGPLLPLLQLSLLRAGLILVPLSPREPIGRLRHLLDDAPLALVVHRGELERGVADLLSSRGTVLVESSACALQLQAAATGEGGGGIGSGRGRCPLLIASPLLPRCITQYCTDPRTPRCITQYCTHPRTTQ